MQPILEDLSNPGETNHIYTKISLKKRLLTDTQDQSIISIKKCLAVLQKGKGINNSQPLKILLEKLNLPLKILKVVEMRYEGNSNNVVTQCIIDIVEGIGPIDLIIRTNFEENIAENIKEGNIIGLSNLRLVSNKQKPQLLSTNDTCVTVYKRFCTDKPSMAECIIEELVDIETFDDYKKVLEMNESPSDETISDIRSVLRWPIPDSYKSETSKQNYTKFKVCDISRLVSQEVSLIGRICNVTTVDDNIRVKIESIQSHDSIHIFIKGVPEEHIILLDPGRVAIFTSLELRLSIQGTIYALMEFSLTRFKLLGNMNNKAIERIRQLTKYPLNLIIDILDTVAIRNVLKLYLNVIQIKHMLLWNACSACDARLEKTDFCPSGCKDSKIILKGKVILIVQDGTGKALIFLKDKLIPTAFGLDEEKIEMIKGWVRGQGEFSLTNKQKPAWNEIWGFFSGCEMRRIVTLCCPFCKGITKSKDDVESIPVPMYIKGESSAELYINGEIQGGVRGAKGLHDICVKAVAILDDETEDIYDQLKTDLNSL